MSSPQPRVIKHYGTKRRSGRYPWGSGQNPFQSGGDFLSYVSKLRKEGLSEKEIAKGLNITTSQLRTRKTIARHEEQAANIAMAVRLKAKGYSQVAIGERMGINESSVRALLDPSLKAKNEVLSNVTTILRDSVNEHGYIDVGYGVESHLGVSRTKLKTALEQLSGEEYEVQSLRVPQMGTTRMTEILVLTKPGTSYADLIANRESITVPFARKYLEDKGRSIYDIETPKSVDASRLEVIDSTSGGADKDGLIELRRDANDLSLGQSKYAQVRIAIGDGHYIKGMAIYNDNLPDGVDIRFNTSKKIENGDKLSTLKSLETDPKAPFKSLVRQNHYLDADGNKQLSPINLVYEEGDWRDWSKSISAQVLSKQPVSVAKKQLDLAYRIKKEEYDEVMALTNPVVKKKLLTTLSDDLDSASVHLKAAGMPRQAWAVILPFTSVKEGEIYAPNHRDGENVALIRYPHGGRFEIPELTVNNKNPAAKGVIRNALDAVGIHPKVAKRLSGADFDGDTVLIIPNNDGKIKSSSPLKGLADFDSRSSYPQLKGMKIMTEKATQLHMGNISNLVTDMTIKGASQNEIARAVRHSMVVIDAYKHKLNYQQSHVDNGIASLKEKYQGSARSGAATLISRAKAEKRVPYRKETYKIDPVSGQKIHQYTGETYVDSTGKTIRRTTKSKQLAERRDAFELSSGTAIERVYATYSNKLKSLANTARKNVFGMKKQKYSPSARDTYAKEVSSLRAKLELALMNKPLERKAQLIANASYQRRRRSNPGLSPADLKKIKGQELIKARSKVGAGKHPILLTLKEWSAVQAGAVTNNFLSKIVDNSNLDHLKTLATPRSSKGVLSGAKLARARTLIAAGHTQSEVADALGVSVSTVTNEFS